MKYSRRSTEKERQNLQNDRERRNNVLRAHETELHKLQLQETELRSKVREKEALQKSVEAMKQEVASLNTQSKVMIQCSPLTHELIVIRTWINKLQKARDLSTYLIESIRLLRPNSIPSSLKRNKRPRNSAEMLIYSRVPTSISNGECLASRERSLMTKI
jgi:chromosome segregation ATPase